MRLTLALPCLLLLAAAPPQDVSRARSALSRCIREKDRDGVREAVRVLMKVGDASCVRALTGGAEDVRKADDPTWMSVYWSLLAAAANSTDEKGLKELSKFIMRYRSKAISRDAMAMVCSRGHHAISIVCIDILDGRTDEDLKLLAAEHLGAIGGRDSFVALMEALRKNAKSRGPLKAVIGAAMTTLTGKGYGDSLTNWEGWWESNRDKPWEEVAIKRGEKTGTVQDTFDMGRWSEFERLKASGKVLVLCAGSDCKCGRPHDLDHIDAVTKKLGLSTETITKKDLNTKKDIDLTAYVAILANCTFIQEHCGCPLCKPSNVRIAGKRAVQCVCPVNKHTKEQYVLEKSAIEKLKKYVEGGGYLFAEDWCMEEFVEKAWSSLVEKGNLRENEHIAVYPKAGAATHPYLKKIFFTPAEEGKDVGTVAEGDVDIEHEWKIDADSRTIHIKDPKRVITLLTSPILEKTARGDDAVAITFTAGEGTASRGGRRAVATGVQEQDRAKMTGGRVLYVLSHFGKQESVEDENSLQNLLINFLVEASERREAAARSSN